MNNTEKFLDHFEHRIKEDREASFFVFLTALSKDSHDPQNIFLRGDSGIGKTWCVTNVLELFDDTDIWMLGGLSPTALVHSYGELVDEYGEPIEWTEKPSVEQIKDEMRLSDPHASKGKIQKEYYEKLKKWNDKLKNSKYVVDLAGKLLVFLDAPRIQTFNMLRPVLSHDKQEISYRFTDKSGKGQLRTQHVVLKGWPATIFCTTDRKWLEDLATRSSTITPKTSKVKLRAACILIGEDAAYGPTNEQIAENTRMKLELQCLQEEIDREKMVVRVPYGPQIGEIIPLSQPRVMRDLKHIMTFIRLNALVNHKNRPKITGAEKPIVLATYEDFEAVMHYFGFIAETTTTGLNQHIINVFHKAMVPLQVFSYAELVDKCKEVLDRPLSSSTLRVYVKELSNVGYVDELPDPNDKRRKVIRVIKKQEKALDYIRNEFEAWFTLDLFKAWLNYVRKNRSEKAIFLNTIPCERWNNDVEGIFNEHYTMQKDIDKKTSLRKNGKTERKNITDFQASLAETSPNSVGNSNVTDSNVILTPISPSESAEKCEYCGQFPVAYELTFSDGSTLRKCQHCKDMMKEKGFKFVVKPLTEVNQHNE